MKCILLFCWFLAGALQLQSQNLPMHEADRLALMRLDTMGICANLTGTMPGSGVSISQNHFINDGIHLADIDGNGVSWRITRLQRPSQYLGAGNLSTTSLYDAFRGEGLRELIELDLRYNRIAGRLDSFYRDTMPNMKLLYLSYNELTDIGGMLAACQGRLLEAAAFNNNLINALPQELLINFHKLKEISFNDNLLDHFPPTDSICTFNATGGWSYSCPCYSGLDSLANILLANNQLGGTFYPEHFLGRAWHNKQISGSSPLKIQTLLINNNNFDKVSPSLLMAVLSAPLASTSGLIAFLTQNQLSTVEMQNNLLMLDDFHALNVALGIRTNTQTNLNTYVYAPQALDSLGIGGLRRRGVGSTLNFDFDIEDWAFRFRNNPTALNAWGIERYNYVWYLRNPAIGQRLIATKSTTSADSIAAGLPAPFVAMLTDGITLTHSVANPAEERVGLRTTAHEALDSAYIYYSLYADRFLTFGSRTSKYKQIIIGDCFDASGNPIQCQELTIQFDNNGRNDEREAAIRYLEDTLQARKIRDCMCGDVQLWQLSDSTELYANGAGTRSAIPSTRNKPGLRSVDANYALLSGNSAATMAMPSVTPTQGTSDAARTLLAIIDSGTDPDHPLVSPHIRLNGRETHADNSDNDGNCLKDDILGFNFLDNNNIAYDDHGHGTAVGGIAAGIGTPALSSTDASVALLPIKYTNRFGQGTTFEAACAIYYAVDYHRNRGTGTRDEDSVRVINASWGYRGEFSEVLHDAIDYAGRRCGVLFVCAAGNDGIDMDADTMGNYPADFDLPNVLVVAAADGATLASYSNYGRQSADIAAFGTFTQTAAPQQTGSPDTNPNAVSGTSFATPYVSRAAAILFNEYPTASAEAVKEALLATAMPLTSADSSLLASGGMVDLAAALAYMANMSSLNFCTAAIGVDETANSEDGNFSNYILYPNPARDMLQIAFTAEYEEATVLLFDAKGVEISRQQAAGESLLTVLLADLPQGLYLVQIRSKGQIQTHKVLKID